MDLRAKRLDILFDVLEVLFLVFCLGVLAFSNYCVFQGRWFEAIYFLVFFGILTRRQ